MVGKESLVSVRGGSCVLFFGGSVVCCVFMDGVDKSSLIGRCLVV